MHKVDTSVLWHSTYTYYSATRNDTFTAEHDMQLFPVDDQLVIQSLPDENGSYSLMRLTVDDRLLTGTWHEHTEPEGHYKGATYYGGVQFVLSEDGKSMRGQWIGFGKRLDMKTGEWILTRTDKKSPKKKLT